MRCRRLRLLVPLVLSAPSAAHAHAVHAAQSASIIDPLVTHHAVLEDELKLNFAGAGGASDARSYDVSLELAYALTDALGVELLVPFASVPTQGGRRHGLGDIELQLPKLSFVRREGWVVTAYAALVLPTGDSAQGLGEGAWVVAPHLLTDIALGPLGLQLNGAFEASSARQRALELSASLAHTWEVRHGAGLFLSPLVEVLGATSLAAGEPTSLDAVGGLKASAGGWHLGAGVRLPLRGHAQPRAPLVMLQVGYHVQWRDLFGTAPTHSARRDS